MKLGRRRPARPAHEHLCLHNYVTRHLPAPPPSCDYSPAASGPLGNIYDNDTLGNCVIAAGYHLLGVWTGNAGSAFTATSAQIVADYGSIGGYVPGRPSTDQGCDEQTALTFWTQHGFRDGSKLLGWLAVDPTNHTLMQQALWLFEGLLFGMELPDEWVNNEPQADGFTWDVAGDPDPANGHAIMAFGYGGRYNGYGSDTWGYKGSLTTRAADKYLAESDGGECYVAVTEAMLSKASGKAPSGLDWPALAADFDAMGGNLPVPAPTPATPAKGATVINWDNKFVATSDPSQKVSFGGATVTGDPATGRIAAPAGWNTFTFDEPSSKAFIRAALK